MHAFEYAAPTSVADALTALAQEDSKLLAGGQTLLPTMKQRLATPAALVDLRKIAGLSGVTREGDALVVGAMTSHADVAASSVVKQALPALAALAGWIGDPAVRHRGTLGGSLANNDPAADYPAAALALGATIVTDRREIAAEDFFHGMFETSLEENEIITKVKFPIPEKAAYQKFRNPASRYAMAGVFIAKTKAGVRVAVTGASSRGVYRETAFEKALDANFSVDAVKHLKVSPDEMISDLHADADYRAQLVAVMARRAVETAA
jgi:carbon-monoxide dehydrogenase medium subunit